jgi:hypothetical protein
MSLVEPTPAVNLLRPWETKRHAIVTTDDSSAGRRRLRGKPDQQTVDSTQTLIHELSPPELREYRSRLGEPNDWLGKPRAR